MKKLILLLSLLIAAGVVGGAYFGIKKHFDDKKKKENAKVIATTPDALSSAVADACNSAGNTYAKNTNLKDDLSNGKAIATLLYKAEDDLNTLDFKFAKIVPPSETSEEWNKLVSAVGELRDEYAQLADIVSRVVDSSNQLKGTTDATGIADLQSKISDAVAEYHALDAKHSITTTKIKGINRKLDLGSCLVDLTK